jgi:hypothetical protein
LDEDEEEEAVVNDENEHDTEEQDDGEHNKSSEEAEAEEADKREDEEHEGEEDLAGEGEGEGAEVIDMAQERVITREKGHTDKNGREGESEDDEIGEGSQDHVRAREDREVEIQGVAAEYHKEAFESWLMRSTDDEEGEGSINFDERESLDGKREVTPDGGKKRSLETSEPYRCSIPKDCPNKRSKIGESEGRYDTATKDLPEQTASPKTTPRPRASSPTLTTASPGSTIAIIHQTSVVPGPEDTKSAVWHAAERDSMISSLPPEQQTKMVRTALSLGSEEGIEELRRSVSNARRRGEHKSESLVSDSNLITSHLDPTIEPFGDALVPQSDCLASLSALYRRLDML